MKKQLAVIAVIMAASAARAVSPEATCISTGNASDFSYHARYSLDRSAHHSVAMEWPDSIGGARYRATADISSSVFDDPMFPSKVRYSVMKLGADTTLWAEGDFECRMSANPAFSMTLRRTGAGTALTMGADKAAASVAVPFAGDTICSEAVAGAAMMRHSLIVRSVDKPARAPFATVDSLYAYLAASADPMETLWEYLDRDIDTGEARLGAKYTIATVRSDSGYTIVLAGSEDRLPDSWQPLDIKGFLTETAFAGHYDLLWYAAGRTIADSEASAATSVEGEVLELTFPMLHSRIRFRRKN